MFQHVKKLNFSELKTRCWVSTWILIWKKLHATFQMGKLFFCTWKNQNGFNWIQQANTTDCSHLRIINGQNLYRKMEEGVTGSWLMVLIVIEEISTSTLLNFLKCYFTFNCFLRPKWNAKQKFIANLICL